MLSCLGIYVDKNLIKYARIRKNRDSFKMEAFNVEPFEDLEEGLKKVISETNSYKIPISINISDELYNYFEVFSILEKKDITKSLDIEFEMLCNEKGYNKDLLESRYILMDNKSNLDKYRSIYISANKNEIDRNLRILSDYKVVSMAPVSTSITNLLEPIEDENIAIINIENETRITTIVDGQINRVDVLNTGMEEAVEKINKIELSRKKAYEVFKNITIYGHDVLSLDENENEYIDVVMPVLFKIANETQRIINTSKERIDKVYITGMGATINNIDLYFQDFFKSSKCEVLKPFFIDQSLMKVPAKEYIEVNSAIALALDGLGFLNKDLNFAPVSKFDSLDIDTLKDTADNINVKELGKSFKEPFDIKEKMLTRGIAVFLMTTICFSTVGSIVTAQINKQKDEVKNKLSESLTQISKMDNELSQIESQTNTYSSLIKSAYSLDEANENAQNSRIISKDAIPNLLTKIMFIIPQQVQIISIKNTEDKHIVIEAVSEKHEQLGYFTAAIKNDGMLQNIQLTNGSEIDSLVPIIIEGDLP